MNALTLAETAPMEVGPAAMMLSPNHMQALLAFAEMMAKSAITVPQHLQGKPSDCLAIAMQAAQWGMNPFAVAQKTHVVSGRLGYEAQLVNAVITSSGAIEGIFHYEFRGTGSDLECRVGATPRNGDEIVWGEWLRNGDVKVRNSPLWAVNPKQQLGYLQVKNWARLYCPGAILGVYTEDELPDVDAPPARPRGPQRRSAAAVAAPAAPLPPVDEVPRAEQTKPPAAQPPAEIAPPAPLPASNPQGGISGGQVAYLRNKLKSAGVDESTVCDRFQVTGIELLNAEQFDALKAELLTV
jgi:hypothetical protein